MSGGSSASSSGRGRARGKGWGHARGSPEQARGSPERGRGLRREGPLPEGVHLKEKIEVAMLLVDCAFGFACAGR